MGGASGSGTRLPGNITTVKQYLSQTGTGAISSFPAWAQVDFTDISGVATIAQGGTHSSTALSNNRIIVSVGGAIVERAAQTASAPMRTDGSGLPTTGATSLTAEVSGVLPVASGGTNSSTALSSNRVMISVSGAVVEQTALTVSKPMRTDGSGLPTTGNTSLTAEVTDILPILNGGTNASTASGAFSNISPMTDRGDMIASSIGTTAARVAGNITASKQFLTQTGTGSSSNFPVWAGIISGDLPTITLTSDVTGSGSAGSIATTLATVNSNVGSFTNASITVDGKGRITAASTGAASSGGGGGSLQWVEDVDSPAPSVENSNQIFAFQSAITQAVYALVKVPSGYTVGNPVKLKTVWYSPDSSGTALVSTQATLVRTGTDLISSTTNQRTSTNTAVTMSGGTVSIPQAVILDLSDSTGHINGVVVNPGDLIRVKLFRGSDTGTSDIKVPVYGAEATFS
jgi:hypothetical protein